VADPATAYTVSDLLNGLATGIFSELKSGQPITANRRMVQNAYVNELVALMALPVPMRGDASVAVRMQARALLADSRKAAAITTDEMVKVHLEGIAQRLSDALDKK